MRWLMPSDRLLPASPTKLVWLGWLTGLTSRQRSEQLMGMQTILTLALLTTDRLMVALLGGPEIIGILAVILILYAAGRLPDLLDRLRGSFSESLGAFDEASHDVGKELGGIFGKHASQALTPDNQTAELYDPAALHKEIGRAHG